MAKVKRDEGASYPTSIGGLAQGASEVVRMEALGRA